MVKICGIESDDFDVVSVEYIKNYFKERQYIQFDSETTGFNSHVSDLICFQIGDYDNQFVINKDLILEFKDFLEEKILIGHNIKFDLCFLYKYGIFPKKVWDTFLAECVITCGFKTLRRSLAAVAKRRLDIDLDKTIRDEIQKEFLTKRVIEYSANDVKYLELIKDSQQLEITRHELKHALEVENQFVIVLAYIEFCGFKLSKEKWQIKIDKDRDELNKATKELDEYIIKNNLRKWLSLQIDMFSKEITTNINWSSSRQVIQLFKELGVPVSFVKKGEEKESVEAKNIEKYEKEFPIVGLYLKYKEKEKEVSTYGESFLAQINKKTGRVHTNFKQVMDTGRLSSGGSDRNTGEKYINFQNIPSDKYTRSCFIAEEGNTLIIADYSGQEQVVLANRSMDSSLLEFYDKGLADMHSFVASKMYPELEGMSLDDIKTLHKDKRQNAKTAGFAINYGGVGATIARNNNLTTEEGEAVYSAYFKAFPGLKDYFEKEKERGLSLGYVEFNDIIKTKSFVEGYGDFLQLQQEINRSFWDRWKMVKTAFLEKGQMEDEYKEMKEKFGRYFKIKGAIERKSLNFPIQGSSATITKISAIYFFKWLRENDLINKVLFVNTVHDEHVIESPKSVVDKVAKELEKCMVKAGQIFCKRVPLKAEVTISDFWAK